MGNIYGVGAIYREHFIVGAMYSEYIIVGVIFREYGQYKGSLSYIGPYIWRIS